MHYRCIFFFFLYFRSLFMVKKASVSVKSGPGWVDLVVAYLRIYVNVVFIKSEQS